MHSIIALTALAALTLLAAPLGAAPQGDTHTPTLTVTGRGQTSARPDLAQLRLGAVAQADDAGEAQTQVSVIMQKALQEIRKVGVAGEALRTGGISLQPVYSQTTRRPGDPVVEPRIIGYRASNSVVVRLDDLDLVGKVIDAGIKAGANQVSGPSFELADDTEQRRESLQRAVRNARSKAEAIVAALDMRLVAVREVNEGGVQTVRPRMMMDAARGRAAASTPVEPGELRVEASVTVVYWIAPMS